MPLTIDPAMIRREAMRMEAPASESRPVVSMPKADEAIWPYLVAAAGQGADIGTTLAALSRGGDERGPLGSGKGVMIGKAAALPLVMWLMHRAHEQGDDKAQKLMGTIMGLAGGIPAAWNIGQMRKMEH